MDFLERASKTISLGVPVIRLRPRTKIAMDPDWPSLATTDLSTLEKWNLETPDANCAAVAKAQLGGTFFLEIDDPSVPSRIEQETGQKIPRTYRVRSRPGRGHYYWKQTPASIALGNQAQGFVKNGDFSVRVSEQYVVAANSIHPISGNPYEIVSESEITEAPDWLIDWIKSQRVDKKKSLEEFTTGEGPIPEHSRNDVLTSIGGTFRNNGLEYSEILLALNRINEQRCTPPLSESEIETIAGSISRYKKGDPAAVVLVDGRVAGTSTQSSVQIISLQEAENAIHIKPMPYPRFPEWVMHGTSMYTGLVKPFCDENSRYPEMMWMPAMAILLNYLGTKVRIERKNLIPSIFMVLIGRRGKVIKSSSVEDAIRYFEYAGVVGHNEQSLNNANGRSLVFTPASPEGLGKEMRRVNCRNGILFYDELKNLTDKSSIESSTLSTTLLTMYESGKYQNIVKNPKDSFSFLPGTYCASLIACSTDKNFNANWSKLAGKSTGLNDRFTFVLPPEVLKPLTPYCHVSTQEGSIKTRQLIDKAIQKGVYRIVDSSPLSKFTAENEDANRAEIRAEKYALGLAVDMGLDEIDEETIERALALVAYEQSVKAYLKTYEASTREGAIQLEVMYQLRKSGGRMSLRDLYRVIHPERLGTSLWATSYSGLIKSGWCAEQGGGVKGAPKELILLRMPEEDDD